MSGLQAIKASEEESSMKKNIGAALALYPSPLIVVGAMVGGKPT